ncbi:tRNA lysidine(34) synthetase TilS [Zongyangia hominis]|uniref:tRNA(Ile)-lysidine synthase n=1 Tax=Zongyangia hominis TaxID=2763677 RepID=A0A926EDD5_9FIRM|nr:tRNA lysidine(34) synthetase TilS [Zongyangia hominis]MBC8570066.1 tRNA lysidine(34) synthetase TilS [Zongyangia hominis]
MNREVIDQLKAKVRLSERDAIIVALSGGADSVCLAHLLWSGREEMGLPVMACHLNHRIRGEEAKRDEDFVRNFCSRLGLPLFVKDVDVVSKAKEQGISLELCGRNERYAFFSSLAREHRAWIATAHTLSDSIETTLFHLARGTGLKGLCGIPERRDEFLRPLLPYTRRDIEDYCREWNLSYVTDSTNLSDDYTRNFIRNHLVPDFERVHPGFAVTFSETQRLLRQDEEFLSALAKEAVAAARLPEQGVAKSDSRLEAEKAARPSDGKIGVAGATSPWNGEGKTPKPARLSDGDPEPKETAHRTPCGVQWFWETEKASGFDAKKLADLPSALRGRALRLILEGEGAPCTGRQLRLIEACLSAGGAVELDPVHFCQVRGGVLRVLRETPPPLPTSLPAEAGIHPFLEGVDLHLEILDREKWENLKKFHQKVLKNTLDYDKIGVTARIRNRKPGDSIRLMGRGVTKTLKKLLQEAGIPAQVRDRIPVLTDDNKVLWVFGFGCDESVAVTEETQRILWVKMEEKDHGEDLT